MISSPSNKPLQRMWSPQGHRVESPGRLGGAHTAYRQAVRQTKPWCTNNEGGSDEALYVFAYYGPRSFIRRVLLQEQLGDGRPAGQVDQRSRGLLSHRL